MNLLLALALLAGPARAQDAPAQDDELVEHTVGGVLDPVEANVTPLTTFDAPPPVASEAVAAALGTDVARVDATRAAVELLYRRDYKGARKAFDALTTRYPTSGIGPLGVALLYQGLMFENFDFRYERQYRLAFEQAREQLALGGKEPGNDAFEAFVEAGILGLDAIYAIRKGELLLALDRGLAGMRHLERTKKLAPAFEDAVLGDGVYLYWRSVVTRSSKLLPDFPDRRAEGIAMMKRAETSAAFLGPGASLALAYAYIEERQLRSALDRTLALRVRYADNVLNNLTAGRIYTSMRRYDDALRLYDEVLGDDPKNQRVHYFRGLVLARMGRYAEAARSYQHYVGFRDVPKPLRSQAWYRLGTVYERLSDPRRAAFAYEQAIGHGGNEAAKRALQRLRKDG